MSRCKRAAVAAVFLSRVKSMPTGAETTPNKHAKAAKIVPPFNHTPGSRSTFKFASKLYAAAPPLQDTGKLCQIPKDLARKRTLSHAKCRAQDTLGAEKGVKIHHSSGAF